MLIHTYFRVLHYIARLRRTDRLGRRAAGSRCRPNVVQGISIQVLQDPPKGGLARHHAGDPERTLGGAS